MANQVNGLHHVTAIAGDPQANIDFYAGVLGLRLVKQTVNFDDPTNYHFYYGNGDGEPGTILTFFPWPGAAKGRLGAGQTTATGLSIPAGSLEYWADRLQSTGTKVVRQETRFGSRILTLLDPDGMVLDLTETDGDTRRPWTGSDVSVDKAIRGLHHVTLTEKTEAHTGATLKALGYRRVDEDGNRVRYAVDGDAAFVDIVVDAAVGTGRVAAGSVHHIAFRTPDDASQAEWLTALRGGDVDVSDVRDRQYFNSIYFHEPGGVLFEIATDSPGFLTDETREALGTELRLPGWYEPFRDRITAALPTIDLGKTVLSRI
jgi:glyoxalase family protein